MSAGLLVCWSAGLLGRPAHRCRSGINALKGLACVLIVWHHLALYEPVLVVLNLRLPVLTDSRQDDGCMAAQVFLIGNSGRGAGWSLLMSWLAGIALSLDFRALGLVFFAAPGVKA